MKPWFRTYGFTHDFRSNKPSHGVELRFGAGNYQAGVILSWLPGFAVWSNTNYDKILSCNWK